SLESRLLLSHGAFKVRPSTLAPVPFQSFTFDGGRGVRVVDSSGEFFDVHLAGGGVVRAFSLPGGRVALRVDGSTVDSVLSIDPATTHRVKGFAHRFAFGQGTQPHILNVGEIEVTSG